MTAGRQYGSIRTDIWRDDDWRALSVDAQWLYELLISQPTISTAGILPLQIAKWSRYAKGMTAKRVNAALNELIDADFVAVDSETEEVLVRTFIRHDAARAGTGNVMLSALRCANITQSEDLRGVLLTEIHRLERDWTPNQTELITALDESLSNGFRKPSESHSKGSVEVEVEVGANAPTSEKGGKLINFPPQEQSLPKSGTSLGDGDEKPKRATRLPQGWMPPAEDIDAMKARFPNVDLKTEHEKFCNYWHAKSGQQATKLDWPATWRNWIIKAADEAQPRRNGRSIDTAANTRAWMAGRSEG